MTMKKIYILFISLLVIGVSAGVFYLTVVRQSGVEVPDVMMETAYGEEYSFYNDSKDKVKLIEFIYTNCPDVCPTTTFRMTQLRDQFEKSGVFGKDIEFITITIDPKRDSQAVLKQYADTFKIKSGSGWRLLRGSEEDTKAVADSFGFMYRDPGNGFLIHSSYTYLLDDKNRLIEQFGMGEGFDKERVYKRIMRTID